MKTQTGSFVFSPQTAQTYWKKTWRKEWHGDFLPLHGAPAAADSRYVLGTIWKTSEQWEWRIYFLYRQIISMF